MKQTKKDQYYCGVDIGGTSVKLGLFNQSGDEITKWSIPTDTSNDGRNILLDIAYSIQSTAVGASLALDDLRGIGVGVPGPVDASGTVMKCVNLGWGITDVPEKLRAEIDVPVTVGNDANVAALGEMFKGGGIGYKNLVMITLGTGVGGGIIINGQILPGANGAAGEIGHLHMSDTELQPCGCGNLGCLEQYASANGIVEIAKRKLLKNSVSIKQLPDCYHRNTFTSKDILDAAKNGDAFSTELVEDVADLLGRAMASISCVTNPEIFVIGGGMSAAGDFLINKIHDRFEKYAFHAARNTPFHLATLGNDAGIYGAVKMAIDADHN